MYPAGILKVISGIRQPSYDVLVRFARLYGVSTDYLLGYTSEQTLDISGLNARDAAIISELVSSMSVKSLMDERSGD